MKRTFKNIFKEIPTPKIVEDDTVLPSVFDLFWDARTGKDLKTIGPKSSKLLRQTLVENGFDANEFFRKLKKSV